MDGSMTAERIDVDTSSAEYAIVCDVRKLIKRTKVLDPRWRKPAQGGVDFYFGKQWDEKDKTIVEARGQEAIVFNQVRPGVRLLIGLMLGQPYDWAAKPVGMHDDAMAEAVSAGLKYLSGVNRIPDLLRWVYWWGLCYGIAWVRVGPYVRWDDPRKEVCQVRLCDPREIGVDMDAREPDRSDMKFLRWSRRIDRKLAKRLWPKAVKKLDAAGDTREDDTRRDNETTVVEGPVDLTPPPSMWEDFSEWNQDERLDYDEQEDKMTVHEVWEVYHEKAWLADIGAGSPVEFGGPEDPEGIDLILQDHVRGYWEDELPRVRKRVICGPYLLEDEKQDAKHGRIPFVSYLYDQDGDGCPVSAVESVKDMQREENYRRAKALYELGNQPVIVDPEIAARMGMTVEQLADHAAKRSPLWLGLANQIQYPQINTSAADQIDLMKHSEAAFQKGFGTNDHLMGYDTPAESGKSKELSMQQGATIQRDGEAALRSFHKSLGELLLSDMLQYHGDEWVVRITDQIGQQKWYTLNQTSIDPETGAPVRVNDINQYQYDIELETVPWSPTARQRASERIVALYQAEEDPIIRKALRKMAITMDDLPNKAEVLQILDQAEQEAMFNQQAQQAMQEASVLAQAPVTPPSGPPPAEAVA